MAIPFPLAGLSFNGLDGVTPTSRGLSTEAQKGLAFVVDCTQAKAFALAHWLVNGADGGRLFVRCFGSDGIARENVAGDVLASLTTMLWNAPSTSWTGGAVMAHSSLNRRATLRTSSRQADLLVPALVQLLAVAPQQVRLGQQSDDAAGLGAV